MVVVVIVAAVAVVYSIYVGERGGRYIHTVHNIPNTTLAKWKEQEEWITSVPCHGVCIEKKQHSTSRAAISDTYRQTENVYVPLEE